MSYETLRLVHIVCAHLSIAGFVLRGAWMLRDSPLLATRWARTLPHINDTVLLAAAIALAVWSQQVPWAQAWLAAKIGGLLAYIGLGMLALKPGRPKRVWMGSISRLGTTIRSSITSAGSKPSRNLLTQFHFQMGP